MVEYSKPCLIADCDRSALRKHNGKRGFCSMHYSRWLKHGDPSRVDRCPSPAQDWIADNIHYNSDDCLIWPFHIGADGYGRMHRPGGGQLTTAAHFMCEAAHGARPTPKHECAHSCGRGNQGCVNPRHLRWATPAENQGDRVQHETSNRGARQWTAKLSDDDIRTIKRLAGSVTQAELARRYDVGHDHISRIVSGKRWAWLT